MRKVNDYDKLVEFVIYCKNNSNDSLIHFPAFALIKELDLKRK